LPGRYFWRTLDLPLEYLRQGVNEFVFRSDSTAFNAWILSLEGGYLPVSSAKSTDAGKNWRQELMGYADAIAGEYLVRIQLGRYAPQGRITSPIIDLAENSTGIAGLYELKDLRIALRSETPEGTDITLRYRMGKSPFEFSEWGSWLDVSSGSQIYVVERFFQWQAILKTCHPLLTPELEEVSVEVQRQLVSGGAKMLSIQQREDVELTISSFPFSYQSSDEPKLAILRQQEKLDEITRDAASEFDQFLRLRRWVAQQWPYKAGNRYPPWDALVILDWLRKTRLDAGGGCMHYSIVFCQCCLSLGLLARLVLVEPFANIIGDGHFMCEVWSNDYRKWILMDATANSHFEAQGVPLSLLETRNLWTTGQVEMIRQVSGPAQADSVLGVNYPLEHLKRGGYQYAGLVLRNDHLTSLSPWEPEHGWVAYKGTGFLWWGRDIPKEHPQFLLYSDRWEDFYWPVNQVQFDLQRSTRVEELIVSFGMITPNFEHFEISLDDGDWEPSESSFVWHLKRGDNHLKAKVQNKFGHFGPPSNVVVAFEPG